MPFSNCSHLRFEGKCAESRMTPKSRVVNDGESREVESESSMYVLH